MISDDESREIFREEALDLLTELESTLLELEHSPEDLDMVNRAFRALHTIKGSGAMFGFDDIAGFTHSLENVFDKIRNGELRITSPLISLTFAARDHILALLNGPDPADPQGNGTPERGREILDEVQALLSGRPASENGQPSPEGLSPEGPPPERLSTERPGQGEGAAPDAGTPQSAAAHNWRIRIRARDPHVGKELKLDSLFDSLRELGTCSVRADHSDLPDLADLDPRTLYLTWVVDLSTAASESDIRDLFFFSDIDLDVDIAPLEGPIGLDVYDTPKVLRPLEAQTAQKNAAPQSPPEGPAVETERKKAAVAPPAPVAPASSASAAVAPPRPAASSRAASAPSAPSSSTVSPSAAASAPAKPAPAPARRLDAVTSLRVAADKLDRLVDLVGELVIVQAQISQVVSGAGNAQLTALSEQLERLSADLRDSTLGIRMLPIGSTFSKYRRLVRDLSVELGKDIELVTRGEETELDKTVLERLGDPLVHLLRNSIDHGVEAPAERKAAGKPARGVIILEAEHSGSEVLVRITDDGRGMDPEELRRKAAEKGLIAPDAELSEQDSFALIFKPGFSTAKQVTNVSGRGVGMDVVHRAIDALRGSVEVASAKGGGTTITIRLPLTLAIIEGLQVQVGEGFYVVPLSVVEECVELRREDVNETGRQRIINLRGELVPYVHLRRWFRIPGPSPEIEQIVVTGVEGRRIGLVVDKVIGEHQTVIKSLGRVYRDVEGLSGATIKGDGSLALILDVPRLVRSVIAERT